MSVIQTIEQGKVRKAKRSKDRTNRILLWIERRFHGMYWWVMCCRLNRLTHRWITEGPFEVQEGDEIFCSHYDGRSERTFLSVGSEYYIKSDGIMVVYKCEYCESLFNSG